MTLTNTETHPTREAVTNELGGCSLAALSTGTYVLNVAKDGAQSINPWLPHESAYVPTLEAIE